MTLVPEIVIKKIPNHYFQFLHVKEAMLQQSQQQQNDNDDKSASSTSIDVESGAPSHLSAKLKFGELADSIITKDYCPTNVQISKAGGPQDPNSAMGEQWKQNICMIRKEEHQQQQQQQQKQAYERVMADERQMKNSLSISPRTKYLMEAPSYAGDKRTVVAPSSEFALDYYVKSRIAEAMRTEGDKRIGEEKDIQLVQVTNRTKSSSQQQQQQQHDEEQYRGPGGGGSDNRGGGGGMKMQDNDSMPPTSQHQQQQQQHQPPPGQEMKGPGGLMPQISYSQAYAYPYSALNMVPNTSTSLSVKQVCSSSNPDNSASSTAPPGSTINEPKPLLSAQYEALSDED